MNGHMLLGSNHLGTAKTAFSHTHKFSLREPDPCIENSTGGTETAIGVCSTDLNVGFEGLDSLVQQLLPLLFGQFNAVHATAVELLEAVWAGHARKGEESQALFTAQPQRLLCNASQDLTARQVTQVTGVCMGHQESRILFSNLFRKNKCIYMHL